MVAAADTVTARGGRAFAGEARRARGVARAIKPQVRIGPRARGRDEVALIEARGMLVAAGAAGLDDLAVGRADHGLCRLVDREWPSPAAARRVRYECPDQKLIARARQQRAPGPVAYIPGEHAARAGAGQRAAAGPRRGAGPQEHSAPRS